MPPIDQTNTTIYNGGGLCNHLFRNLICSEISRKYNLKFSYICYGEMIDLGVRTYIDGEIFHTMYIEFNEGLFEHFIQNNDVELKFNIFVQPYYFQTPFIARYLRDYFLREEVKKDILEANQFRDRHGNNNDLVVHIRLGDAIENNPGLEYYENMMARVDPYDKAWLATDEVNHPICQSLIEKYGFIPLDYNAVDTLKFGSTCRQIILSGGTFSWIMAVMGYQTQKVFYPDYNKRRIWHGDIFVFDDWIKEI